MLTAKEARSLVEEYAYSQEHFLDEVLYEVRKLASYTIRTLTLGDISNFTGFRVEHLETLKEIGYKVTHDESNNTLTIKW